jgi:integral membrane sensor domain MASE1
MTTLFELLENSKRSTIGLALLLFGCFGGSTSATIVHSLWEILIGNTSRSGWQGADWWLLSTVTYPFVGVPLGLLLSFLYACFLDNMDRSRKLAFEQQQQQTFPEHASAALISDSTDGLVQEPMQHERMQREQEVVDQQDMPSRKARNH